MNENTQFIILIIFVNIIMSINFTNIFNLTSKPLFLFLVFFLYSSLMGLIF